MKLLHVVVLGVVLVVQYNHAQCRETAASCDATTDEDCVATIEVDAKTGRECGVHLHCVMLFAFDRSVFPEKNLRFLTFQVKIEGDWKVFEKNGLILLKVSPIGNKSESVYSNQS